MATEVEVTKQSSWENLTKYLHDVITQIELVAWPAFPLFGIHARSCPRGMAKSEYRKAKKRAKASGTVIAPRGPLPPCNCEPQVERHTLVVILSVFVFAAYFKIVDKLIEETVLRSYNSLVK